MGKFIASKHLPEEAGLLLEEAINREPKKPPTYFPTHEDRYIITQKDVAVDQIQFKKPELEWYCEASD